MLGTFCRFWGNYGAIKRDGSIVDATFVDAPRRRNTSKTQDRELKKPESERDSDVAQLSSELDKKFVAGVETDLPGRERNLSHRLEQTDTDARWAKKDNETHFGYKVHVKCDEKSKFIVDAIVTPANVTDVDVYPDLIDEKDNEVRMDAGYMGAEKREQVEQKFPDCKLFICNK